MIPVMGTIVEKSTVARTMRTLGTLVQSGVPILESLNIVKETAGNAVFERAFTRIYESIREGETIAQPLREARIVDDIVVNMIDVGEETGELDTMLNKIADNYDEEVETAVESLVSLLEPIMIVVLGGIIGFIVIALFLPLITLITKLSGMTGGERSGQLASPRDLRTVKCLLFLTQNFRPPLRPATARHVRLICAGAAMTRTSEESSTGCWRAD